jgi:hypothetical protein
MKRHTLPEKTCTSGDHATSKTSEKPAGRIHIPELYRLPARDRDAQGCMKARV